MKGEEQALNIVAAAVEKAGAAGADAADATLVATSRLNLDVHGGEIENLQRASSRGLGLRVTREGKTALVHTTDLSAASLDDLAAKAVEMAGALPPSRDPVLRASAREIAALPAADPGLMEEPFGKKRDRLIAVERAVLAVPEVARATGASYNEVVGEVAIANSNGLRLARPVCNVTMSAEALAERDGDTTTGGRYASVPARAALPDPEAFGREAGERAVTLLGARPVPSTKAAVLFTPFTGWAFLARLTPALRGDHVASGRSYLGDQLGKQLAAPGVTIRDNPLLREGPSARAFDAEGTPTQNRPLIEGGVLAGYLTDLASAEKLGVDPGGNATRDGYNANIEIGTSNYYMDAGTQTAEAIIKNTARGLLLMNLAGWWVGMSPATDTFSSAAMGLWIEDGEIVHPVRGVTIGSTLREMLAAVDAVGDDLRYQGQTNTPTFRIAEMAISGT
jgi:PmbA protein